MTITIKEIENIPFNGKISSQLKLEITGINAITANTLRRIIQDDLPIYAFPPELIKIEQNTSTFNNDQMKDHLSQLPILNQDCGINYLDPMYWKEVDYKNLDREKHENEKTIDLYVNVHNVSPEVMNVTIDNAKIFVDGEQIDMWEDYTEKPLLIQLKPDATFKCHMRSALGTAERNAIWSAGLAFPYEDEKDKKIIFTLESFGQMDEYTLLIKSCEYINHKLNELKKHLEKNVTEGKIPNKKIIFIELEDEDFTLGNIVNDLLQDHPNIIFAGVAKPDHLIKTIRIKVECDDKFPSPIKPLYEVIDDLTERFNTIKTQLKALYKKSDKDNKKETVKVINKKSNKK
jgi:DNA-directed RNA polymerase subunit L